MNNDHNNRLARLALNGQGFAFDPQTGESFTLNDTARLVLTALCEDCDMEAVARKLAERYHIEPRRAWSDVQDFMAQLRAMQLLENPA